MATPPPENMGCISMLTATAFASLLLTLGISPPLTSSLALYVPVLVVTTIVITLVATPLYFLALHFKRANLWTAMGAGFVTGALFPVLSALGGHSTKAWFEAAAFGAVGVIGGLTFFLTATAPRSPRRNAAAMVALAAVSIAAALLIRQQGI